MKTKTNRIYYTRCNVYVFGVYIICNAEDTQIRTKRDKTSKPPPKFKTLRRFRQKQITNI